ncbi:MAG: tetratricopeptide repeat protein [Rhodomicrobium sp.]
MPMSSAFRAIKLSAIPLLFAAVTLGLATIHVSLQRKAERARSRSAHIAAVQDSIIPDKLVGVKLKDLASASEKGDLAAKIEMGRRLAQGEGVKKNEAQAARYFQSVIAQAGEIAARDKRGPLVAVAFRYLAQFNRLGVPAANIASNPAYAFDLLHHAASYFGDPVAQFELAKLFMNGDGVTKSTRTAAQWLLSASRKGYAPAQATLGEMLWRGNGVRRAPGDGLGLLAIARRNATPDDKAWVSKMFETARAEALPIEILEANAFIVQEMAASRLGTANENLIRGNGPEAAAAGAMGTTAAGAPVIQAGQQSSIIHGNSQGLSGLRLSPMDLKPDAGSLEPGNEKSESNASAGIIQMYRLWELELRSENAMPVRLAGVAK